MSKLEAHSDSKNREDSVKGEIQMFELNDGATTEQDRSVKIVQGSKWSCLATSKRIYHNLRTNNGFQQMFIYSICLFIGKFIQGWCQSLFGPSYIDIRMISGTDLAQGSWILTSRYIGSTIGSTMQGMLYGRSNSKLTFGSAMIGNCIAFALIPWCAMFEAMVFTHVLLGIAHGIYASGISADVLRIWGKDGRVVLLGCQLILTFGSALGPLAVTPFLNEPTDTDSLNNSTTHMKQTAENITVFHDGQSYIYIPFSLTSLMSILSGMFFFLLYIKYDRITEIQGKKNPGASKKARKLPKPLNIFVIGVFGLVLCIFTGVNETFSGFLATYCVQYFHWSKKDGALVSFLFFLFALIAQIIGIVVNKWMNTIVYTVINFVIMVLSVLGILITSLYHFDTLVWLFVPLLGFAKGINLSMIFSWTNDYFLPVTGKVSAFYYICLMMGGALNPVLIGYVMESMGLVWFCYVFLIETIAMFLLIAVMVVATRYVNNHFGRPLYESQTSAEEAVSKDQRLEDAQTK